MGTARETAQAVPFGIEKWETNGLPPFGKRVAMTMLPGHEVA